MSLQIKNHLPTYVTLFFLFFSPFIVGSSNVLCQISFPFSTKWTHFLLSSFLSTPFPHTAWLPIRDTLLSFVTYTSVAIVHFLHVINLLLMCTELFLAPRDPALQLYMKVARNVLTVCKVSIEVVSIKTFPTQT